MPGHPHRRREAAAAATSPAARSESATAIRGGALRVLGYACGVLVSLATATILVRHLGIQGFGRYVTVTSLIALVGGVTEAGIVVHGIREFLLKDDRDRRELMGNLLAMRLTLAVLGVALAVCFSLAIGYRQVMVFGALVAGAGLLVQVIADVMSVSLQAQLLLGRLTAVELARRALTLVLIAVLALAGAGLLPLLGASALAGAVALASIAWMVRRYVAVRLTFDLRRWRELLAETSLYAIALSIASIYLYVTVIVMSAIATPTQTGLFATSFRVTQAGLAIPGLLLTAVFPLMTRRQPGEDADADPGEAVGKVFTVAVICGVWMALATALGARFIVDVIAGRQGAGSIAVLRIHSLMFVVSFLFTAGALYLVSIRRYRPLLIAASSALALNIVLALILVPDLGARGGALADVITEAVAASGLTAVVVRAVPGHRIAPSFVAALALACAASASMLLLPVGSLAQASGATVIYFAVLLAAGAVPREVVDAARRLRHVRASA
jgi:O-antigen/teichoic acid export membrane protein